MIFSMFCHQTFVNACSVTYITRELNVSTGHFLMQAGALAARISAAAAAEDPKGRIFSKYENHLRALLIVWHILHMRIDM
jgi:hypothetical protein